MNCSLFVCLLEGRLVQKGFEYWKKNCAELQVQYLFVAQKILRRLFWCTESKH